MLTKVQSPDYTLSELRELKAEWLRQAEEIGLVAACRRIARHLGQPFNVPYYATWVEFRWEIGNVLIRFFEGGTYYLPNQKKYNRVETVNVFVGEYQVAHVRTSDDAGELADNFVVMGDWVEFVLPYDRRARELSEKYGRDINERQRAELVAQLLIGVGV